MSGIGSIEKCNAILPWQPENFHWPKPDANKFSKNSNYGIQSIQKVRFPSRIYHWRKFQLLDVGQEVILDCYYKECRSILEYATPVWTSGLTKKLSANVEHIQKVALAIASGYYAYGTPAYIHQCNKMGVDPLYVAWKTERKVCY